MPEGDTIYRSAVTLQRAIGGQVVTRFETVLPKLARVDADTPVAGRTVERVRAEGKWLLIEFSGDLVLLTHMLMSGSWHIYRPGERWRRNPYHMRIVIETGRMVAVAFNVPVAEFHTAASLERRRGLNRLGPSLLAEEFDAAAALANLDAHPDLEIGEALLRQSVLAGIGNVFKSEICFVCRVHPFRKVGTLSRGELEEIVAQSRKLLLANSGMIPEGSVVTYSGYRRTTGRADGEERLWVYGRAGEPCRRCGAAIVSEKRGESARISFWCPACQPAGSIL